MTGVSVAPSWGGHPWAEEVERLAVQMAEENPTWGYRRIQGALANLGHQIDKITVRNILRRRNSTKITLCP